MQKLSKLITLIIVGLSLANPASAQIYSWVDENGKTHFGDRVPEKYKKQSEDLTEETSVNNVSDAVEPRQPVYIPDQKNRTSTSLNSSSKTNSQQPSNSNSCQAQWAAYRSAEACYNQCAQNYSNNVPGSHGQTYTRNTSACGRCRDAKKPSCKL
jgi:hypothetical protein